MQDNTINELRNASPSALDAQQEDLQTAIDVIEASKEDLKDKEWVKECFDVVAEALKEKEAMH